MATETHIHWNNADPQVVDILNETIEIYVDPNDPQGMIRVRGSGSIATGTTIPTDTGWEAVPDTGLETRGDASDMLGMVRLRVATP